MKLKEMNWKKAIKITKRLIPRINNFVKDEELKKVIASKLQKNEDGNYGLKEIFGGDQNILDILLMLLENHEEDVNNILAIVNDKTVKEIEECNLEEIQTMVIGLLGDGEFKKLVFTQLKLAGVTS